MEDDDGTATLSASGGRPDYSFSEATLGAVDSSEVADLPPGLYTFTTTDDNGCQLTETVTLTQPEEIVPEILRANNLSCFGIPTGSFVMGASGGTPGYTFSTDNVNFQTDSLLGNLPAGDQTLYAMDANGCTDSIVGNLTEPQELIVEAGDGGTISLGFDTVLTVASNYNPIQYVWGPDSAACLDPPACTRVRAAPVFTTDYFVEGTNAAGCVDTAFLSLQVIEDRPVYVPNAFSPDGNGENDRFTIYGGRAVAGIDALRIYSRWGGLVFEREGFAANEPDLGWDGNVDGKQANPAVFVYHAVVRFVNGSTVDISGDVTLIR